jgi:hypothetical protein
MIQFTCRCGKRLQAKEEHVGLQIICPGCGQMSAVPGDPTAVRPLAPAAPPAEQVTGRPLTGPATGPREAPRPRGPAAELSGKALASLILGALTFLLPVVLAIPAIILAILAIRDVNRSGGRLTGKGLALAGFITGSVGNLTLIVWLLGYWGVKRQEARVTSQCNLKEIALAMHSYHDVYKQFPSAVYSQDGKQTPLLSWRVAILPFIEQNALYQQFRRNEPWDSPHNLRLLGQMPPIYAPVLSDAPPGQTHYQVFTGPRTPFNGPLPMRIMQFTDGTSNTFLVVEADDTVPWTKPADLVVADNAPLPRLGGLWGDGFLVAMADGSVRPVSRRVREQTLRLLIDPRDGQVITDPEWGQW